MAENVNYQRLLDRQLAAVEESGRRPRLLLHSCCAPCSSYVLEYLTRYFDIDIFYYNPNISPAEEYEHRVQELIRLVERLPHENGMRVIRGEYEPKAFARICQGHEDDPEGGERCERCFRLRLGRTARLAGEMGSDFFTTTLTISPLKNARLLNAIGEELGERAGVAWLYSDFKKKNGYKRSCELSAEYGLYRQDYCGCAFSRREREKHKLSPD